MMIGNIPEREKVVKFWFGLNTLIQNEMYKMHLNPEVLSLRKVQHTAEIIELAHLASAEGHPNREEGSKQLKNPNKYEVGSSQSRAPDSSSRSWLSHPRGNGSRQEWGQAHQGAGDCAKRDKPNDGSRPEVLRDNKLSKEEHDRLMSEGKCFICKEAGHMSCQCPKCTNIPSNQRDRPLGVPSYAMHVDTGETEQLECWLTAPRLLKNLQLEVCNWSVRGK
jgi:hypothetical protein